MELFMGEATESRLTQLHEGTPGLAWCLVSGSRGPTQNQIMFHIRGLCHWAGEPAGHLGVESPSRRTARPRAIRDSPSDVAACHRVVCGAETHLLFTGHSAIDASDTSARRAWSER